MSDLAVLECSAPCATLRLCRPQQHNALSLEMLDDLHARLDELEGRDDISVLSLTGEGRSFCAGMDLKAVLMVEGQVWPGPAVLESLAKFTLRLRALPMVVVAVVNGAAIGGGCGLLCVADLALTYADAKIGLPEVDLGLCPAVVAPWVVRKLGAGRARRVMLSGGVMDGQTAFALGLVDRCAPDRDGLDALAAETIARLASGGAHALRATKHLLNKLDGSLDASAVLEGASLSARVLSTPEAQARLAARSRS
jgi:enoyl-CoA hydratase/carnithine racemase